MVFQDTAASTATPATETGRSVVSQVLAEPVGAVSRTIERVKDWAITQGPGVLAALLLLLGAIVIAGWVRKIVITGLTKAHVDLTLAKFFGNLAKWAIIIFAVIACLGTFGINTTSFAALIGATGLAVGLALQGNLGNLASGILLLVFRPFKIGDSVIVAGQAGIVDGIDLFTTNLDTIDNRRIIVPNGAIFSGIIENQTHHPQRCVTVSVPVALGADMDQTREALARAVDRVVTGVKGALRAPGPGVAMTELAPVVTWSVNVWTETANYGAVRQALLREVKLAVDGAGIGPGAAVMHVHVKSMPPPA